MEVNVSYDDKVWTLHILKAMACFYVFFFFPLICAYIIRIYIYTHTQAKRKQRRRQKTE